MKQLITFFAALALILPLQAQSYSVQVEDKDIPVAQDFTSLLVQDDFEVTLTRGTYGVRLTVDRELAPYVNVYVRSKTLNINYSEKDVPKDVRKLYKGKNAPKPVFRVIVSVPEIDGITLEDNASLTGTEEFVSSRFELNATGKSQIKSLYISAVSARVNLKKSAQAILSIRTDNGIEINTEGSSNLKLAATGKELTVRSAGSSAAAISGENGTLNLTSSGSSQVSVASSQCGKASVLAEGSSKVTLTGSGEQLTLRGTKSALIDAGAFPVKNVEADLSHSAQADVNVSGVIEATLVGGSALHYTGSPEFKINKIVKSTLAPYGTTK